MKNSIFITSAIILTLSNFTYAETVLVANKNFSGEISKEQLKQLLRARADTLTNGQQVSLLLPNKDQQKEEISQNLLNISHHKLQRRYNKVIFSGEGSIPKSLDSQEILAAVRNKNNAIGLIDSDQVDDTVKILRASLW